MACALTKMICRQEIDFECVMSRQKSILQQANVFMVVMVMNCKDVGTVQTSSFLCLL